MKIYLVLIRPILEYAVQVWQDIPNFLEIKLETIRKRALRIIFPHLTYEQALIRQVLKHWLKDDTPYAFHIFLSLKIRIIRCTFFSQDLYPLTAPTTLDLQRPLVQFFSEISPFAKLNVQAILLPSSICSYYYCCHCSIECTCT